MRTGRTGGQAVGQTDRRHKLRQYPTACMDQGSTLGYIFSSYFNNLCGHHFWVIFRILTISLWSWKIQHISIPYINLVDLWMKSVNSLVPVRHKQILNTIVKCRFMNKIDVQFSQECLHVVVPRTVHCIIQGWPGIQWVGILSRMTPVRKGCYRVSRLSTRGKVVTSLGQPQTAYRPREAVNWR